MRNVVGEHIVVPVGDNYSSFNGMIVLNAVSSFVFEKMSGYVSEEELLGYILDEFDVERERAKKDLDELLGHWRSAGILEEAE